MAMEAETKMETGNEDEVICRKWVICMKGFEDQVPSQRERRMEKVPRSLLQTEKGTRNREYYEPAVVSLGPYHHNPPALAAGEEYKLITLKQFSLSIGKPINLLYDKVFEVVHDARKCYIDNSTDAYSDEEFNLMMLRDACVILFFIECVSNKSIKMMLLNEHLGTMDFINLVRDIFLLENQIPFVVLEVLLNLKFMDKGEDILAKFFNFLNHGTVDIKENNNKKKVLQDKWKPLHLLELYRSYFISLPTFHDWSPSYGTILTIQRDEDDEYNYMRRSRGLISSATELREKWIYLYESTSEDDHDMTFESFRWHGEFKIASRAVSAYTKAIYMNMIAYEMCPHNPNDFRVSTYVRVMKALIVQDKDVKELRDGNVLIHGLGRDEDVVKMFDDIEVPAVNLPIFNELRHKIRSLQRTNFKIWMGELVTDYFGSPWKTLGTLVGAAVLVTTIVQTYLAIHPRGR